MRSPFTRNQSIMGYTVLETDKVPEVFKNKSRWVTFMVVTTGILMITVSAVSIGVFIGYTYCYIEHQTGIRAGNITQSKSFQIVQLPMMKSKESKNKRCINEALLSSVIVRRIFKIGHALLENKPGLP